MKEFKKMPKMADGGSVDAETKKYVKPGKPDLSGGARGFFSDLKTAMEKPAKTSATKGGGSMGGGDMSGMKGLDKPYKRGGKVKK